MKDARSNHPTKAQRQPRTTTQKARAATTTRQARATTKNVLSLFLPSFFGVVLFSSSSFGWCSFPRPSHDDDVASVWHLFISHGAASFLRSGLLSSPRPLRDAVVLSCVQSGFRLVVRHGAHVCIDVLFVTRVVDVRVGVAGNPTRILGLERGHCNLGDMPFRDDAGSHGQLREWD